MGSQRVGRDSAAKPPPSLPSLLSKMYFYLIKVACNYGEGNGTPLQYYGLENPMDGGAW